MGIIPLCVASFCFEKLKVLEYLLFLFNFYKKNFNEKVIRKIGLFLQYCFFTNYFSGSCIETLI